MLKGFIKISGLLFFAALSIASATDQERLASRQANCAKSYGYQYGTSEMAQCVERSARDSGPTVERINACMQRFQFGSPDYNLCVSR